MNYAYMLRCADGSLYSGWTSDVTRRLAAHNGGSAGAKYTRTRRPVALAHCEAFATQGEAMRREAALKKLTHAQKEALAAQTAQAGGEFLTVLDAKNVPCGDLPRAMVHRCGLRHRVVHLLVCQTRRGVPGVWLQQRGFDRPTLPGAYDWSATGHVDPGETPEIAVLREAREEIGLHIAQTALVSAGEFSIRTTRAADFEDDEIAHTFLYFAQQTPPFQPGEEVARLVFAPQSALAAAMEQGAALPLFPFGGGAQEVVPARAASPNPNEWKRLKTLLPTI